jgi:hypothetical protein
LRWGFTPYHPYIYQNANGDMRGSWAKRIENLAHKANILLSPVKFDVSQMQSRLDDESVHFYTGIKKLIENSDAFLVSETPVQSIELIAYSYGPHSGFKQVSDLKNQHVIVLKGLTYNGIRDWIDDPRHNVTIANEVTDYDEAFRALKKLKKGYFLGYRAPATATLRFLPQWLKRDLKETTFERFHRFVFIRKTTPNADNIMQRINQALPQLN